MLINYYKKLVGEASLIRFLSIGGISALVYFGTFTLLYKELHWDYRIAVSLGYIASVVVHFFSNRKFTFQAHTDYLRPQVIKYIGVLIFSYLMTLLIMQLIVTILHLNPYIGIVLSICSTTILNFFLLKNWVFAAQL